MTEIAQTFLDESCRLLRADYLPKIERSMEPLSEEEIWWRPNAARNSIGNLVLHLRGNVGQWIIAGVGGGAFERNRPLEFDAPSHLPSGELLTALRITLVEAEEVIRGQDAKSLGGRRQIQGYDVTVQEAIYHVVEHFGMHTGQIILLSKIRTATDLKLWEPPAASSQGTP